MRLTPAPSSARSVEEQLEKSLPSCVDQLTSRLGTSTINSGGGHKNIVNNGEGAFTPDPIAILVLDPGIGHDSGFIEADPAALDDSSERDLVWVEIFPT